jgi:hypothetical protein
MNKYQCVLLASILGTNLFASDALAKAQMTTEKSFAGLKTTVEKLGKKAMPHTLVVMDNDDTLTMMSCPQQNNLKTCQYLGGPAWFSWQDDLLKEVSSPYKVADNFGDLLDISALLFAMNNMVYAQPMIPDVLESLSQSGVKLMVLTARGTANLSSTASQLDNLSIMTKTGKQDFLDFIAAHAPIGNKSGLPSVASPFTDTTCNAKRPVSYQQGVMYVAGQNKGDMLKCLLARTETSMIKNIVFIDDTLSNVEDVYGAFKDSEKYIVKAIHYTALKAHKEALTKGPMATKHQDAAKKRWEIIKATMHHQLQTPVTLQ